jgi:hypothetical protein
METMTTTIPPERYHPLTSEEFSMLNGVLQSIGHNLPENQLPYIWDNFNRLRGANEGRPCSCQSAASHWIKAISYLREWVKERV